MAYTVYFYADRRMRRRDPDGGDQVGDRARYLDVIVPPRGSPAVVEAIHSDNEDLNQWAYDGAWHSAPPAESTPPEHRDLPELPCQPSTPAAVAMMDVLVAARERSRALLLAGHMESAIPDSRYVAHALDAVFDVAGRVHPDVTPMIAAMIVARADELVGGSRWWAEGQRRAVLLAHAAR